MHKQVSDLIHLEASKGVLVPRLSDHMNSNSFLVELFEVLQVGVREKVSDRLAEEDVEISNIEGKRYLELILSELRKYYRRLETQLLIPSSSLPPSSPLTKTRSRQTIHNVSVDSNPGDSSGPRSKTSKKRQQKGKTKKTATPQRGNLPSPMIPDSNATFAVPPDRWACPLVDHQSHTIQTCTEFFKLSPKERRWRMIRVSCFTCLGRGAPCTDKQCGRIAEVLPDVICKDCSKLTKAGRSPSNIVLPTPPTTD
jgi:hypothetical protein